MQPIALFKGWPYPPTTWFDTAAITDTVLQYAQALKLPQIVPPLYNIFQQWLLKVYKCAQQLKNIIAQFLNVINLHLTIKRGFGKSYASSDLWRQRAAHYIHHGLLFDSWGTLWRASQLHILENYDELVPKGAHFKLPTCCTKT